MTHGDFAAILVLIFIAVVIGSVVTSVSRCEYQGEYSIRVCR